MRDQRFPFSRVRGWEVAFHPLKAPARQTDFSEPLPVKVKRWLEREEIARVRIPERGSPFLGVI